MSYIIKSANPFASTKLTEKGREKLAKGQLTFNSWAIGDSEINYNREVLLEDLTLSGSSRVLRPKDKQPDLNFFINTGAASPLVPFGSSDVRCIKAIVDNEAEERGHFTGNLATGFTTNTDLSAYTRTSNASITVNGGTSITIAGVSIGDLILLKVGYGDFTNDTPTPHLWFKAQNVVGSTVTVDRTLPNVGSVACIVYKFGEISDNEGNAISYWDTGTLSFDVNNDITSEAPPIWNMNTVFGEDILGITGTTENEKHIKFGSYDYLGEKENYLYASTDTHKKSASIIHYSNKSISNQYGEFLYVNDDDNKLVKMHLPDLMYHRRTFSGGSTTGDKMGMTFLSSGVTTNVGSTELTYIDLIEDPTLVNDTPLVVGRVYPDLKIIVIDDAEIVAAISYKSNRNWTLPKLNLGLANPAGGVGTGTLGTNETMYVTYSVDNNSGTGIAAALPCQNYATITNTSVSSLDVQFNIEDVGLFPYMRDDGTGDGFYGDTLNVMYQVTTNGDRPTTENWKLIDYSAAVLSGGTINVLTLESQNPLTVTPNFQITQTLSGTATTYSVVDTLTMAPSLSPEILQFGDERFFYGNIETYIGATIYKTLFNITINASNFNKTTNISRSSDPTTNPPTIKVSEVGIYDNDGDLVIISKLSNPIKLTFGTTIMIELSIDF